MIAVNPLNMPFELRAWKVRLALEAPYKLAFGPVSCLETIFVQVNGEEGQTGLGEASFLTGYTDEVFDESWSFLQQWVTKHRSYDHFHDGVTELAGPRPFLASALRSALDMAAGSPVLNPRHALRVPVLGLLQGNTPSQLEDNLHTLVQQGYRTLKLKVGFEPLSDSRFVNQVVKLAQSMPPLMPQAASGFSNLRFRVDANQGFSSDQAIAFLKGLNSESITQIELFEQPCSAHDWDAHARVVPHANDLGVKLMLDESIYNQADIQRAADQRLASFIKVKLMKFEGLDALISAIALIKELGMTPVLGNGVASDINCWMEGCVADLCIANAGEMNGYLKQKKSPLLEPLAFENGYLCAPLGWRPSFNFDALESLQEGTIRVSIES